MIPIFSTAFANSSGSTVPLLLRSKYLNALRRTDSSLANPVAFYESFDFKVFSKLDKIDALEQIESERDKGRTIPLICIINEQTGRSASNSIVKNPLTFTWDYPCFLCSVLRNLIVINLLKKDTYMSFVEGRSEFHK